MIAHATYAFLTTALWQGALIASVALLAIHVLRITDASSRAYIWSAAFFLSAILPFAIFLPGAGVEILPLADETQETFVTLAAPTAYESGFLSTEGPRRVVESKDFIAPAVLFLWIAGTLWRLAVFVRDASDMATLRRESEPLSGARFGLPANADIRVHPTLNSPLASGLFRPAIILPQAMFENGGEDLRSAIAHECAHVERGDILANFAEAGVLCLFWWNPALHLMRWAIAENREMACDDRAVMQTNNVGGYASALIACAERALADRLAARATSASLGVASRPSGLARRVARLADCDYAPQMRAATSRLLLASAVIALTTACAAAASPRVAKNTADASPSYAQAAPRSKAERLGRDLVEAVLEQDRARAEQLLADGADINAVLEGDGTPLIAAVNDDAYTFVELLLANGADINAYARYDETALISAVRNSQIDMVRLLIDAGADVNLSAKTETGETRSPLGEARLLKRRDVENLLLNAGAVQ